MEILKTMRAAGHDLACVTTGSKQNATEVLEHFGVREWFGLIVTGEDVEKQKPDPEGYCRAMEHFRVTPADTMIFEDSGIGLTAPRPAGQRGIQGGAVLRYGERGAMQGRNTGCLIGFWRTSAGGICIAGNLFAQDMHRRADMESAPTV